MTESRKRFLILVESLLFSVFIGWYIWQLQGARPRSWLVIPTWLLLSFIIHRDTPKTLGWSAGNLWTASRRSALAFLMFVLALCIVRVFLGAFDRPSAHLFAPSHFLGYAAFCFLQQVGLNSYLTNRLLVATESPARSSFLAAAIFAALHWPNPVLVPLTFLGGAVMSWLFARERNILPLTIGQAILGTLVWWAFPSAWHHAMRVGPGFYHFDRWR
jgi:hypothetical protein